MCTQLKNINIEHGQSDLSPDDSVHNELKMCIMPAAPQACSGTVQNLMEACDAATQLLDSHIVYNKSSVVSWCHYPTQSLTCRFRDHC